MEFRTETIEKQPYIAMVHMGAYDTIGSTWEKLFQVAGPNGWANTNTSMIAVYNDDPSEVAEADLRSYACISKPYGFEGHDGFEEMEVGGGRYLIGKYVGPYSGLGEAWQAVTAEGGKHGPRDGDCFEKYVVHDMENPEKCVTEIHIPIIDE
jgi:AraC family transcriptional regulator